MIDMVEPIRGQVDQRLLHRLPFRAMGCAMDLRVVAADAGRARVALDSGRALIRMYEERLSRFLPTSELTRLNEGTGGTVYVSSVLWSVISVAMDWAKRTNGLFDPTVLPALVAHGYDRSFEDGPLDSPRPAPAVVSSGAWSSVRLDQRARAVTLPGGVSLDLGGVAKGWAADRVAELLGAVGPCLVDAGGDIATRGAWPSAGWPIGLCGPGPGEPEVATVRLRDGAVATSGVDIRAWSRAGIRQHHLIDPRTGRPAVTDVQTCAAIADRASTAEVHAKVALLLGCERGLRYLESTPDVEGLLTLADGTTIHTTGFERYVERT
ncbi:MAG: FAD:protein FMN transferase [Chloroflexota bacterium]